MKKPENTTSFAIVLIIYIVLRSIKPLVERMKGKGVNPVLSANSSYCLIFLLYASEVFPLVMGTSPAKILDPWIKRKSGPPRSFPGTGSPQGLSSETRPLRRKIVCRMLFTFSCLMWLKRPPHERQDSTCSQTSVGERY
jgi:hypothetical protein